MCHMLSTTHPCVIDQRPHGPADNYIQFIASGRAAQFGHDFQNLGSYLPPGPNDSW